MLKNHSNQDSLVFKALMPLVKKAAGPELKAFLTSDMVSIGQNPENADMSNPNGDIYGHQYKLIIEDPNGHRWSKNLGAIPKEDANQKLYDLLAQLSAGQDPRSEFQDERPGYGSEAYQSEGIGEREAFEERKESPF